MLGGIGGFFLAVFILAKLFREPLQALGTSFVERFGLPGIFLGTFIADAFSCPIPPQFYMLTVIASGREQVSPLVLISISSLLAGSAGYLFARHLERFEFFRRLLERTRESVDGVFRRWGSWAIVIASITPIPYSMLCYTAGFYRMPRRLFVLFLALRVPRLLVYYAALKAGWSL